MGKRGYINSCFTHPVEISVQVGTPRKKEETGMLGCYKQDVHQLFLGVGIVGLDPMGMSSLDVNLP